MEELTQPWCRAEGRWVSGAPWAGKHGTVPPARSVPAFVRAKQPLTGLTRSPEPLLFPEPPNPEVLHRWQLPSKHPALTEAPSSFVVNGPLLCSSHSHRLWLLGAEKETTQTWVSVLLRQLSSSCATCSNAPAAAWPTPNKSPQKTAKGSSWSTQEQRTW